MLNVVNFGGGTYVLYAEIHDDGTIEVDPEPYADNFARPARLLPLEAKALVAAIDLIGDHLPAGRAAPARARRSSPRSATTRSSRACRSPTPAPTTRGSRASSSKAIAGRKLLELDYYKENEDEFTERDVEPYALVNGREGWYVAMLRSRARTTSATSASTACATPRCSARASSRGPRSTPPPTSRAGRSTGEVPASRIARVWVSPGAGALGARGADRRRGARRRRGDRRAAASPATDWLVREVLKEAGDAVVLEPDDAREAVLGAVRRLRARRSTLRPPRRACEPRAARPLRRCMTLSSTSHATGRVLPQRQLCLAPRQTRCPRRLRRHLDAADGRACAPRPQRRRTDGLVRAPRRRR